MLGGLLCERRHSEATPAMKPSHTAIRRAEPFHAGRPCSAASAGTHPSTYTPLPSFHQQQQQQQSKAIVLRSASTDGSDQADEPIAHTGKCIRIGGGKYEFWDCSTSLVGRGSYGIVFRGHRCPQRQTVAIKRMWSINVRQDELEAMKCVRNKNLVALLDVYEEEGTTNDQLSYLVMELCDTDLDRHLRWHPGGKLGSGDMRVVVASIANGYYALFRKHIVHRDIKPQNILLQYGSQRSILCAKITDFGVSRVLADEQMGLCNVAGTLLYMAPEVGANLVTLSEYDHCADVWSIGCLIYQCLTGKTPFDEASLCRLFLHCAGANYAAYEVPTMSEDKWNQPVCALIKSLLQIDRSQRITPSELYEKVCRKKRTGEDRENEEECEEAEYEEKDGEQNDGLTN